MKAHPNIKYNIFLCYLRSEKRTEFYSRQFASISGWTDQSLLVSCLLLPVYSTMNLPIDHGLLSCRHSCRRFGYPPATPEKIPKALRGPSHQQINHEKQHSRVAPQRLEPGATLPETSPCVGRAEAAFAGSGAPEIQG
jgi:hypothetical protein